MLGHREIEHEIQAVDHALNVAALLQIDDRITVGAIDITRRDHIGAPEEHDAVAIGCRRAYVKDLDGFPVREDGPFRREIRVGGPRVRCYVGRTHPVQHVDMRDDRRAGVETARVDRVNHAHVASGLREIRRASCLLVAAAGEHDVPNRARTQAAHRFEHVRTHRRRLRVDDDRSLWSDLHGGVAAGPDKHVNLALRREHVKRTLSIDRRSCAPGRGQDDSGCRALREDASHRLTLSAARRAR